jgi:hypothetical protein
LPDGAGRFPRDSSGPAVLRDRASPLALPVRGSHPLWPGFPAEFRSRPRIDHARPTTPTTPRRHGFGLIPVRSPLLGEFLFWSPLLRLLRCFSSAGSPPPSPGALVGCPIRTPVDLRPFAPTHGFSQLTASFFASVCLGILRAPSFTFSSRHKALVARPRQFASS